MKKVLLVAALFLLFGLVSNVSAQQVLGGTFKASSAETPNFTLDKNNGDRIYSTYVSFEKGFDVMPLVILSVTKIEADKNTNLRYNAVAEAVSRDGFTIKVTTWSDTKILNIGGNWLAVSPAK